MWDYLRRNWATDVSCRVNYGTRQPCTNAVAIVDAPTGGLIVHEVISPVEILGLVALALAVGVVQLTPDVAAAAPELAFSRR
jgi:hypothetical protein